MREGGGEIPTEENGVLGDGSVRFWDMATGSVRNTLRGYSSNVYSVAFSPEGSTLASGSDNTILFWDVVTGTVRSQLTGHDGNIGSVCF